MLTKKIIKIIKNPKKIIIFLASKGIIPYNDKKYLKYVYKEKTGDDLNLDNPKKFTEKLQWLKLFDRNPLYPKLVDKYEVRDYVKKLIGEKYLIPCLGVYDNVNEIDFEQLPNQFVLKTTHDSGTVVICKNKKNFDISKAKKFLSKRLKRKYFYLWREWPYKDVKPRIIAEKYMEDKTYKGINDYKFYCFNGEPKIMFIILERNIKPKMSFYDMNFNKLDMHQTFPDYNKKIEKPKNFEKMIQFCKILGKNFPHVRIDFYECNDQLYFGELTFFDSAGFDKFSPDVYNDILGEWIDLERVNKYNH